MRSATLALKIAVCLSFAGIFVPGHAGASRVTLAILPSGTEVEQLSRFEGISPGLLSAGLGGVRPEQTFLDITQGNRVFNSLYDDPLTEIRPLRRRVAGWAAVVERADSAPADIVPGLLADTLNRSGVGQTGRTAIAAAQRVELAALVAADRGGAIGRAPPGCHRAPCLPAVLVRDTRLAGLARLVSALRGDDLLIAIERPPPRYRHRLAIAIAGAGFDGNLSSDSTRMRGYVLSIDIAPTILDHFGIEIPAEMSGQVIRSEGDVDFVELASLEERLSVIAKRRGPVISVPILAWLGLVLLAGLAFRARGAAIAFQLLALSVIYLPLMLLVGAALRPSVGVERLVVGVGAPLLALLTLRGLGGFRALAAACGVTTVAYAIDVIAGSPLSALSLMGPNPGLGVRFYGIGNELEATLAPLVLIGTGAALSVLATRVPPRRHPTVFLVVGLLAAAIFAAGRFGADVGAAIVFPVGAAAAVAALGAGRRGVLLVIAAPLAALGTLAVVDLVLGGDAHLTRSVLDAGGLEQVGDVVERRLRLSARSFERAIESPYLPLVGIVLLAAFAFRRRILTWFEQTPALRAGFIGAAAATLVGTVANDSGALLLEVGTGYLLLVAGYAWAEHERGTKPSPAGGVGSS